MAPSHPSPNALPRRRLEEQGQAAMGRAGCAVEMVTRERSNKAGQRRGGGKSWMRRCHREEGTQEVGPPPGRRQAGIPATAKEKGGDEGGGRGSRGGNRAGAARPEEGGGGGRAGSGQEEGLAHRRGWGRAARRRGQVGMSRRRRCGGALEGTGWGRAGENSLGARRRGKSGGPPQGNCRAPPAAGNVGDWGKVWEKEIRQGWGGDVWWVDDAVQLLSAWGRVRRN
nr:protein argonaute 2-like [Lolium perenne]